LTARLLWVVQDFVHTLDASDGLFLSTASKNFTSDNMKIMEAIMRMTDWALRDQIKEGLREVVWVNFAPKEMMIKEDAGRRSQVHFVRRTKRG